MSCVAYRYFHSSGELLVEGRQKTFPFLLCEEIKLGKSFESCYSGCLGCLLVCVLLSAGAHIPQCSYGDQMTVFKSCFSLGVPGLNKNLRVTQKPLISAEPSCCPPFF